MITRHEIVVPKGMKLALYFYRGFFFYLLSRCLLYEKEEEIFVHFLCFKLLLNFKFVLSMRKKNIHWKNCLI